MAAWAPACIAHAPAAVCTPTRYAFITGQYAWRHPAGLFAPNVDPKTGKRFRGGKGSLYEGGLRVPFIVRWPGRIAAGEVSDYLGHFSDVMPTLAELAGAKPPASIDGFSLVPTLLGEKAAGRAQPPHEYLYWEDGAKRAVRCGTWKLVGTPKKWELYDLAADIEEKTDMGGQRPDIVEKLAAYAEKAHTPNRVGEWLDKSKSFRPAPGVKSYMP